MLMEIKTKERALCLGAAAVSLTFVWDYKVKVYFGEKQRESIWRG